MSGGAHLNIERLPTARILARPVAISVARVALLAVAVSTLLAACGTPAVRVIPAEPNGRQAKICDVLMPALPDRIDQAEQRTTEPSGSAAAAWGDPAIVLRCGIEPPATLTSSSPCTVLDGVGWFAEKAERGYVFTTIGREALVEVTVPSAYAPEANALIDLAPAIRKHDPETKPCV